MACAGVLAVLSVLGVHRLQHETDGLHNAISPRYWLERYSGLDLYNSEEHFLKRGPRDRKAVLLTFDDGPHPASAQSILDTLKEYQVPATFFVVGKRVKEHPELVREMLVDGHEVGNHTENHRRLDTLEPKQIESEIEDCEHNVEKATGHGMSLLRPPGMRFNETVLEKCRELGYTIVGWNIGAKDFVPNGGLSDMSIDEARALGSTPEIITERVLKQVKNGTIILLHDNPVTALALPSILKALKEEGYEFATTAEFLHEMPKPVLMVSNPIAPKPRWRHASM